MIYLTITEKINAFLEILEMKKTDLTTVFDNNSLCNFLIECRDEIEQARKTSNYWKMEHLEDNKLIEQLQSDLDLVYEYDSNLIDVLRSK